jgi:glutamate-5-semialdehyde dehydrogenase
MSGGWRDKGEWIKVFGRPLTHFPQPTTHYHDRDMNNAVDLARQCRTMAERAKAASFALACTSTEAKNRWLLATAQAMERRSSEILDANEQDVAAAADHGLSTAAIDRLKFNPGRLKAAAESLRQVAALPDPVGEVRESQTRPNGLLVNKIGVPLGVVFFIYESRPNVTLDAAALCVKSGNAVILRGGKEAIHSNVALHRVLSDELGNCGLTTDAVQLVTTADREAVGHLLSLGDLIDLAIPRGGKSLIERVLREATMPVLKHFDGNCHIYVDESADLNMAESIIINAKCQRPGVCNAAESLLIHKAIAAKFLPRIGAALTEQGVEIRGCGETCKRIPSAKPATEDDYRTEFLDLIISIKIVETLDEAVLHINQYGSKHTDAIIASDTKAAQPFAQRVDSSCVMVNASTRFNDGFELGLGAEIGISTDKFHARGPCGLKELTTYKYVVTGNGQIRN